MLIQKQTIYGDKVGNCFSTCIASWLNLPTEEVPNFCHEDNGEEWFKKAHEWLRARGWNLIEFENCPQICIIDGTIFIASGKSPRGDFKHAVIYGAVNGGWEIIMDPHIDNTGLDGPFDTVCCLVPVM